MAPLFLLGIALAACGDDGGDGGTPPPTTAITKSISGSGDAQVGTVGQPLAQPIRVLVTEDGLPAPGLTVSWSTASGGSLAAATATSDAAGIASNNWTLGTTAGPQTAQATLTGASGSPVTFNATANAGAATTLAKIDGDAQTGPIETALAELLVTKVSDDFGNGIPGISVAWTTADDATLSAPVVISDATGNSAVGVTLGSTEGPITITATADGLTGSPQTFTATAGPPGPVTATVTVAATNTFQPAGLTVAAGTTVTWQWAPGAVGHNVAPVGGTEPPRSGGFVSAPNSYSHRFDTPGTYNYICEAHAPGMSGVITVQ